jgi:PqqA peptide cyclase
MIQGPLSLIAELTHACPLKCLYCSNPINLAARNGEISTSEWTRVIAEAASLGVSQISFTGGEPCLRPDLPELIKAAVKNGLYVNLITSGVGLSEKSLASIVDAGTDHIQLSFQDTDAQAAKETCGVDALAKKKEIAALIAKHPVAFTVNLVIHRNNHPRLQSMIDMAVELGAQKIEVAHVQFNGWALKNRARLMPTQEMLRDSMQVIATNKENLRGRVRIDYVLPDYYADTPKPCMGGWAKKMMLINPLGLAMPCHSAETLSQYSAPSVRELPLKQIWFESELFNAFRGEEWMEEPCRSCERKEIDFGGCRCQALALVGNANATDPVCKKSSDRTKVDQILLNVEAQVAPPAYRA